MIISNKHTSFFQVMNLFVIGMWILLCLPFYYMEQSTNMLIVLISGALLWSLISIVFFKFYTIKIDDSIEVRNIFVKRIFLKSDLIGVEKTSFSPFIFRIKFNKDSYYFLIGYDKALNALLSSNVDTIRGELNRIIREHLL